MIHDYAISVLEEKVKQHKKHMDYLGELQLGPVLASFKDAAGKLVDEHLDCLGKIQLSIRTLKDLK